MKKLTNEQLAAFTAFGLIIANDPSGLLEFISKREAKELAANVDAYLSPLVQDNEDMVTPLVIILRNAIEEVKANQ
jgi:hypothetical protein